MRLWVLLCLWCWLLAFPASAAEQVQFAAEPAWRIPVAVPDQAHQSPASGQRYLLVDRQLYLNAAGVQRFQRFVIGITSTEGLEKASQLAFDFDPDYETLTIHKVQVWRDGKPLDRLEPQELRVFQREADLERFLYSGTRTAYLILPDIRVGDVLEYSYSVSGNNPVMGGRYSDVMPLEWDVPIERSSLRLLVAPSRALFFDAPKGTDVKVQVSQSSGEREILWTQDKVPAIELESDTPAWYMPNRSLGLSEFASWADVVAWARPLYDEAAAVDPAIQQMADQLAKDAKGDDDKIMAALHFVQQEIRYLGMEDGIGSHRPRKAADTLYRRYGDCKDKTVLLMALLKAMGLAPTAALVSLEHGAILPNQQPSPYLFDHVLVTLMLDGKRLWLDGTSLNQGSNVDTLAVPYLRYALLVAPEVKALTAMDGDYRPAEVRARHEIFLTPNQRQMQVDTLFVGDQAEQQRSQLKVNSLKALSRRLEEYYSRLYGEVTAVGAPDVHDDTASNELMMSERYVSMEGLDKVAAQGVDIYADLLDGYLKEVNGDRSQPLALSPPIRLQQEFLVHLPKPAKIAPYQANYNNAVFRFGLQVEPLSPQLLRVNYRYENLLESVPVAELAKYRENVRRAREQLSLNFTLPVGDDPNTAPTP